MRALELVPKPGLEAALLEAVRHAAGEIEELRGERILPFHVSAGRLRLDVERAFGRRGVGEPDVFVRLAEIEVFEAVLRREMPLTSPMSYTTPKKSRTIPTSNSLE